MVPVRFDVATEPLKDDAVIIPLALIPVELIVTAVPTIAELKVETPVTLRSLAVAPAETANDDAVTIPAAAKIPAALIVTPLPTIAEGSVETPAVTTIPPAVTLTPFPAVTKPTESIFVTSS